MPTRTDPAILEEAERYRYVLDDLVRKAMKSDQWADLAGEPALSLLALRVALKDAVKHAESLRTHRHEWDNNDYCMICGADGRA